MKSISFSFVIIFLIGICHEIDGTKTTKSRVLVGIGGALGFKKDTNSHGKVKIIEEVGEPYYFYQDDPDNKFYGHLPKNLNKTQIEKLFEKIDNKNDKKV